MYVLIRFRETGFRRLSGITLPEKGSLPIGSRMTPEKAEKSPCRWAGVKTMLVLADSRDARAASATHR